MKEGDVAFLSKPLPDFIKAISTLYSAMKPFLESLPKDGAQAENDLELQTAIHELEGNVAVFDKMRQDVQKYWNKYEYATTQELLIFVETDAIILGLAESSRDLVKRADHAYKLVSRLLEQCEKELDAKKSDLWNSTEINGARKTNLRKEAESARKDAVEQLKCVRYFYKQAHWLLSRFPEGKFRDVEGLVKLVSMEKLEANEWSLTPGRYVGIAPEEVDEDFDFEEALRDIHLELVGLNDEALDLAAQIAENFQELGI